MINASLEIKVAANYLKLGKSIRSIFYSAEFVGKLNLILKWIFAQVIVYIDQTGTKLYKTKMENEIGWKCAIQNLLNSRGIALNDWVFKQKQLKNKGMY